MLRTGTGDIDIHADGNIIGGTAKDIQFKAGPLFTIGNADFHADDPSYAYLISRDGIKLSTVSAELAGIGDYSVNDIREGKHQTSPAAAEAAKEKPAEGEDKGKKKPGS